MNIIIYIIFLSKTSMKKKSMKNTKVGVFKNREYSNKKAVTTVRKSKVIMVQ